MILWLTCENSIKNSHVKNPETMLSSLASPVTDAIKLHYWKCRFQYNFRAQTPFIVLYFGYIVRISWALQHRFWPFFLICRLLNHWNTPLTNQNNWWGESGMTGNSQVNSVTLWTPQQTVCLRVSLCVRSSLWSHPYLPPTPLPASPIHTHTHPCLPPAESPAAWRSKQIDTPELGRINICRFTPPHPPSPAPAQLLQRTHAYARTHSQTHTHAST